MKPYFQDDSVTIYHGDNREILALEEMASVDHLISDPPYSERTQKGARSSKRDGGLDKSLQASTSEVEDVMLRAAALGAQWAILTMDYMAAFKWEREAPSPWRQVRLGVWDKLGTGAPQMSGDRPAQGWEAVAHLWNGKTRPGWNGGGLCSVYRHRVERGRHPTQKPLSLLGEIVNRFTDRNDLILDPWAGSGTTGVAAKQRGRRAILIEQDEKWCEFAASRMSQEVFAFT